MNISSRSWFWFIFLRYYYCVQLDEENKEVKNADCEKKDVNESGYSSAKAVSPVQSNNLQASVENNRNEILAEALTEINSSSSPSPIYNVNSINDGTMIYLFVLKGV